MEPRFGSDLSGVRVHTGRQAAESAAAVNALAYTAGRHIVFGAGQYSPDTSQGRSLIAHELAHAVQQGGSGDLSPQTISDPADASEHEADRAAEAALRAPSALESASPHSTLRSDASLRLQLKASAGVLQRRIVVDPGDQVGYVLRQLDKLCPQQLGVSGTTITQKCAGTPADQSCGCACDAAGDPVRTYTVHAYAARVRKATKTLWDGSQAEIPETTVFPTTWPFNNPDITVENEGSAVEFGSFAPNGEAKWYEHWRILAHELCGHGRLQQSYSGEAGKRPGHDVTIKTENDIAGEKGEPERGYSWNPRQGESFYNPIGDRSKIVFSLANGLHYEAP